MQVVLPENLKIYELESVDSTSLHAVRVMGDHESPFLVTAKEQTCGKGQRGKVWRSERGNIFFSLGFPEACLSHLEPAEIGAWTLKVAVAICEVIESEYSLVAQIKWPNDILIGGKKVCGILCESSLTDKGRLQYVVVGVGINVDSHPDDEELSYLATDLISERRCPVDSAELAAKLCERLLSTLERPFDQSLYRTYMLPSKIPYVARQGVELFTAKSVLLSGELHATNCTSDEERTFVSADDAPTPLFLSATPVLIADMGNSALKIGGFVADRLETDVLTVRFSEEGSEEKLSSFFLQLREKYPVYQKCRSIPLYYGSVNSKWTEKLENMASSTNLFSLFPVLKKNYCVKLDKYPLAELGIDRLALLESYLGAVPTKTRENQHSSPTKEIGVVVSFGTATTVDAITHEGIYLGGWIASGLATGLKALSSQTDALPLLEAVVNENSSRLEWGTTTLSSLQNGAIASQLGLVENALKLIHREFPGGVLIYLTCTGGASRAVVPFLEKWTVDSGTTQNHECLLLKSSEISVLDGLRRMLLSENRKTSKRK